jgi:hypothetical protein
VVASLALRELHSLTAAEWDDIIGRYRQATVFHLSSWHQFLNESLPGRVERFQIESGGQVCGHWCGFMVKKFGVKVFGAPLPGTATDYMYPLFSVDPPSGLFLASVKDWAAKRGVAMVDVGGQYFDDVNLVSAGYRIQHTRTYRVDLSGGEQAVWNQLKPAMRNKVRKAEKAGVTVAEDHAPDFGSRFFDMLCDVFNRQGLAPSYGLHRIETAVRILKASGHLVPLTAWLSGEALASIILLWDGRTAYYWAGASYPNAYPVAANDLIQWRALQLAVGRGHVVYDACGGGAYKEKLGGTLISLPAGHLSLSPMFSLVRAAVAKGFRAKQTLLGSVQRATRGLR